MPSTASTRLRVEQIGEFEKTNAWAASLNAAIQRLDDAVAQFTTIALTGNYTLTSANFIVDEARAPMLRFTGTGSFIVTAPAVSKLYCIINDCTGDLTITPSGGTGSVVRAGTRMVVAIDGSVARTFDTTLDKVAAPVASVSLNSQKITNLATPTLAGDAATKGYVDTFTADRSAGGFKLTGLANATLATQDAAPISQVVSLINASVAGLPVQTGNAGKFLETNGTTASWQTPDIVADTSGTLTVARGGTGLTTLTAGSVLVGNGASAPTLVAPGTAGQALLSNGAGVAPSFQTFASAGLVPLSSQSPSGVATVDITSGLTSTYDEYEIHIINLVPASNADVWLRTDANAGASFDAGASDYAYRLDPGGGAALTTSGGAAQILLTTPVTVSSSNSAGFSAIIRIYRPSIAKNCTVSWNGFWVDTAPSYRAITGFGERLSATAVNAVRLLFSTGNISSGFVNFYGVRKT